MLGRTQPLILFCTSWRIIAWKIQPYNHQTPLEVELAIRKSLAKFNESSKRKLIGEIASVQIGDIVADEDNIITTSISLEVYNN